jgi:hypothetical protein
VRGNAINVRIGPANGTTNGSQPFLQSQHLKTVMCLPRKETANEHSLS